MEGSRRRQTAAVAKACGAEEKVALRMPPPESAADGALGSRSPRTAHGGRCRRRRRRGDGGGGIGAPAEAAATRLAAARFVPQARGDHHATSNGTSQSARLERDCHAAHRRPAAPALGVGRGVRSASRAFRSHEVGDDEVAGRSGTTRRRRCAAAQRVTRNGCRAPVLSELLVYGRQGQSHAAGALCGAPTPSGAPPPLCVGESCRLHLASKSEIEVDLGPSPRRLDRARSFAAPASSRWCRGRGRRRRSRFQLHERRESAVTVRVWV